MVGKGKENIINSRNGKITNGAVLSSGFPNITKGGQDGKFR